MTATPGMFMELLVDNLNLYDSGWTVGTVIEAPEKLLSFNHEKCWAVLGRLAEEFDTEFEIVGKTVHCARWSTSRMPRSLSAMARETVSFRV